MSILIKGLVLIHILKYKEYKEYKKQQKTKYIKKNNRIFAF